VITNLFSTELTKVKNNRNGHNVPNLLDATKIVSSITIEETTNKRKHAIHTMTTVHSESMCFIAHDYFPYATFMAGMTDKVSSFATRQISTAKIKLEESVKLRTKQYTNNHSSAKQ
jgi:L-ribulose-5-phosphate 3-epimerase UlaE